MNATILLSNESSASLFIEYDLPHEVKQLVNLSIADSETSLDIRPPIIMYGKTCHQNRNIGFFSNASSGYHYSSQKSYSKPLTGHMEQLLHIINDMFHAEFNGILINKYCDGNDYIGAHSDDERGLDPEAGVIVISSGVSRKFRITNKVTNEKVTFQSDENKIWQMKGNFQRDFKHEIPIERKVVGARYSLTFRKHVY